MGLVLFINQDQEAFNHLKAKIEPEHRARLQFYESMQLAIQVLANPENQVASIVIDTNDSSYSLLRFVEQSLISRPITPIFVSDHSWTKETPELLPLLRNHHIQSILNGNEKTLGLVSPKTLSKYSELVETKRQTGHRTEAGYVAVPIVDFIHHSHYTSDVFVKVSDTEYRLFAGSGHPVNLDYLLKASTTNPWLYVFERELIRKRNQIKQTQKNILKEQWIPSRWKSSEIVSSSKKVLDDIRLEGSPENLMDDALTALESVFQLASELTKAGDKESLSFFIGQAKRSERTLASLVLAVMMCAHFKFAKDSIIEILGLACLFQDISLFNSPFGDLSKVKKDALSPDALNFYLKHPLSSADLLAGDSSLPAVVLQVIRQHHECRDRSGYPNRIGGTQLHPMAEVLSIINAYLDLENTDDLKTLVYPHYSDEACKALELALTLFHSNGNKILN